MKFALDTEFIDTPTCSALISLALVAQDERSLYFEFEYPEAEITPWLRQNVVPLLKGEKVTSRQAAGEILGFVGGSRFDRPEFWAYYAAHDWYWFCRVFGGMMEMPEHYPHLCKEFAYVQQGVPNLIRAGTQRAERCALAARGDETEECGMSDPWRIALRR